MRFRLTGLWRHPDFVKLWTGQTISLIGSQVTFLALPLTAVLVLNATPAQMGFLTAAGAIPSLLVGLFAGVWVDRHRRRPILIAADLGRAALLLLIPVAALLGVLRIEYLYIVAFLVGTLGLFFEVAHHSFLPSLVGREQLVEGNSKLEISDSVAEIVGPGLAGGLVQLVTAPIAIAVDAISFLISALFLGLIRTPEPAPKPPDEQQNIFGEVVEGLALVSGNALLRAIAGGMSTVHLFNSCSGSRLCSVRDSRTGNRAGPARSHLCQRECWLPGRRAAAGMGHPPIRPGFRHHRRAAPGRPQ